MRIADLGNDNLVFTAVGKPYFHAATLAGMVIVNPQFHRFEPAHAVMPFHNRTGGGEGVHQQKQYGKHFFQRLKFIGSTPTKT